MSVPFDPDNQDSNTTPSRGGVGGSSATGPGSSETNPRAKDGNGATPRPNQPSPAASDDSGDDLFELPSGTVAAAGKSRVFQKPTTPADALREDGAGARRAHTASFETQPARTADSPVDARHARATGSWTADADEEDPTQESGAVDPFEDDRIDGRDTRYDIQKEDLPPTFGTRTFSRTVGPDTLLGHERELEDVIEISEPLMHILDGIDEYSAESMQTAMHEFVRRTREYVRRWNDEGYPIDLDEASERRLQRIAASGTSDEEISHAIDDLVSMTAYLAAERPEQAFDIGTLQLIQRTRRALRSDVVRNVAKALYELGQALAVNPRHFLAPYHPRLEARYEKLVNRRAHELLEALAQSPDMRDLVAVAQALQTVEQYHAELAELAHLHDHPRWAEVQQRIDARRDEYVGVLEQAMVAATDPPNGPLDAPHIEQIDFVEFALSHVPGETPASDRLDPTQTEMATARDRVLQSIRDQGADALALAAIDPVWAALNRVERLPDGRLAPGEEFAVLRDNLRAHFDSLVRALKERIDTALVPRQLEELDEAVWLRDELRDLLNELKRLRSIDGTHALLAKEPRLQDRLAEVEAWCERKKAELEAYEQYDRRIEAFLANSNARIPVGEGLREEIVASTLLSPKLQARLLDKLDARLEVLRALDDALRATRSDDVRQLRASAEHGMNDAAYNTLRAKLQATRDHEGELEEIERIRQALADASADLERTANVGPVEGRFRDACDAADAFLADPGHNHPGSVEPRRALTDETAVARKRLHMLSRLVGLHEMIRDANTPALLEAPRKGAAELEGTGLLPAALVAALRHAIDRRADLLARLDAIVNTEEAKPARSMLDEVESAVTAEDEDAVSGQLMAARAHTDELARIAGARKVLRSIREDLSTVEDPERLAIAAGPAVDQADEVLQDDGAGQPGAERPRKKLRDELKATRKLAESLRAIGSLREKVKKALATHGPLHNLPAETSPGCPEGLAVITEVETSSAKILAEAPRLREMLDNGKKPAEGSVQALDAGKDAYVAVERSIAANKSTPELVQETADARDAWAKQRHHFENLDAWAGTEGQLVAWFDKRLARWTELHTKADEQAEAIRRWRRLRNRIIAATTAAILLIIATVATVMYIEEQARQARAKELLASGTELVDNERSPVEPIGAWLGEGNEFLGEGSNESDFPNLDGVRDTLAARQEMLANLANELEGLRDELEAAEATMENHVDGTPSPFPPITDKLLDFLTRVQSQNLAAQAEELRVRSQYDHVIIIAQPGFSGRTEELPRVERAIDEVAAELAERDQPVRDRVAADRVQQRLADHRIDLIVDDIDALRQIGMAEEQADDVLDDIAAVQAAREAYAGEPRVQQRTSQYVPDLEQHRAVLIVGDITEIRDAAMAMTAPAAIQTEIEKVVAAREEHAEIEYVQSETAGFVDELRTHRVGQVLALLRAIRDEGLAQTTPTAILARIDALASARSAYANDPDSDAILAGSDPFDDAVWSHRNDVRAEELQPTYDGAVDSTDPTVVRDAVSTLETAMNREQQVADQRDAAELAEPLVSQIRDWRDGLFLVNVRALERQALAITEPTQHRAVGTILAEINRIVAEELPARVADSAQVHVTNVDSHRITLYGKTGLASNASRQADRFLPLLATEINNASTDTQSRLAQVGILAEIWEHRQTLRAAEIVASAEPFTTRSTSREVRTGYTALMASIGAEPTLTDPARPATVAPISNRESILDIQSRLLDRYVNLRSAEFDTLAEPGFAPDAEVEEIEALIATLEQTLDADPPVEDQADQRVRTHVRDIIGRLRSRSSATAAADYLAELLAEGRQLAEESRASTDRELLTDWNGRIDQFLADNASRSTEFLPQAEPVQELVDARIAWIDERLQIEQRLTGEADQALVLEEPARLQAVHDDVHAFLTAPDEEGPLTDQVDRLTQLRQRIAQSMLDLMRDQAVVEEDPAELDRIAAAINAAVAALPDAAAFADWNSAVQSLIQNRRTYFADRIALLAAIQAQRDGTARRPALESSIAGFETEAERLRTVDTSEPTFGQAPSTVLEIPNGIDALNSRAQLMRRAEETWQQEVLTADEAAQDPVDVPATQASIEEDRTRIDDEKIVIETALQTPAGGEHTAALAPYLATMQRLHDLLGRGHEILATEDDETILAEIEQYRAQVNAPEASELLPVPLTRVLNVLDQRAIDVFVPHEDAVIEFTVPSRVSENIVEARNATGRITNTEPGMEFNTIYIFTNGEVGQVQVNASGEFSETLILRSGNNEIIVSPTTDPEHPAAITREIFSNAPQELFRATLRWDADETDLDLTVFQPNRQRIWWSNDSPAGVNGTLDVDDQDGFGPEAYSLTASPEQRRAGDVPAGTYTVGVIFYDDGRDAPEEGTSVTVTLTFQFLPGAEGAGDPTTVTFEIPYPERAGDSSPYWALLEFDIDDAGNLAAVRELDTPRAYRVTNSTQAIEDAERVDE